jgi:hypothetical protein
MPRDFFNGLLTVSGAGLSDDGLRAISRLKALRTLTIVPNTEDEALAETCAEHLRNLPHLSKLHLGVAILSERLEKLRRALPNCEIDFAP